MNGAAGDFLNRDHYLVLSQGKFDGTSKADLDHLFSTLAEPANQGKPLVIHFHGGLVSENDGMNSARALAPAYA